MSANEALTHDSVRDYLIRNNGKVKNIDLVQHFKRQLNDPVNRSKARGDFKEIVDTLATVQTIDGAKYFVLKKPKEAPAVLHKPPRPTKQRDWPVFRPPTFRTAKLEEITGGPALHLRQLSREESPDLSVSNKENDGPAERKESNHERSGSIINASADSGVDTDFRGSVGSRTELSSFAQMCRKLISNSDRFSSSSGQSTDRLSYSNNDLDRVEEDIEDTERAKEKATSQKRDKQPRDLKMQERRLEKEIPTLSYIVQCTVQREASE